MNGRKSNMTNAPLTFQMLPNLTKIFILRGEKTDKRTYDVSCNAGDGDQHCVHETGGLKCIQSNFSSDKLQVDNSLLFSALSKTAFPLKASH